MSGADWDSQPWGRSRELKAAGNAAIGFASMPAASSGVTFTNLLSLDRQTTNQIYLNGSGVALGDVDGDGRCDGSESVGRICEGGEDVDNDGSLDGGETDPTDPGSTAEANCAPGDVGFPDCSGALNPGEGEGEGEGPDLNIAGSALLACGAVDAPASGLWASLLGLGLMLRRRRR